MPVDTVAIAAGLLAEISASQGDWLTVSVPGRVNLIGEHIDYHGLPVLPMAIDRRISIAFRPRGDCRIRIVSRFGNPSGRIGVLDDDLVPGPPGDWLNYVKAA